MTPEEIAALVDQKVAERTQELEAKLAAVEKNRDSILREKRELEGRAKPAGRTSIQEETEQQPGEPVIIPRHADPQTYQRLKSTAQERGVPYVVADEDTDPTDTDFARAPNSNVKFVETDKTLYANQAMQRSLGIAALIQQAEAKGKALRIFRRLDDLDPKARAMHADIVAEGDPNSFVLEN
jgi:hypothetical protein